MMGGALSWVLDKVEGGMSFLGFGTGSDMSPLTQSVMNEIAVKVSTFGTGLVQDAQKFNNTQAPIPPALQQGVGMPPAEVGIDRQKSTGSEMKEWQQKVEIKQEFHIQGDNAMGIAAETSRKMETALHQLFPGGLAPVSN